MESSSHVETFQLIDYIFMNGPIKSSTNSNKLYKTRFYDHHGAFLFYFYQNGVVFKKITNMGKSCQVGTTSATSTLKSCQLGTTLSTLYIYIIIIYIYN